MTSANSHEAKASLRFYDGHNRHAGAGKHNKVMGWKRRRRRGRANLSKVLEALR